MPIQLDGRARRFGDDINTDYIIASARKRETIDESILKRYLLEAVDPAFAGSVRAGDVIVAGRNFGCGSAMEVAATVILGAGIKAVIATTVSRTFFRNAVNNGLVPIECDTSTIGEGERLAIRVDDLAVQVRITSSGRVVAGAPMPPIMLDILACGGLVPYIAKHGTFVGL